MARLILHIGLHKTGTTTIQDMFHANRRLLAEHGLIYPKLGRHTGHHGLFTDWLVLPAAYRLPGGGVVGLRKLAEAHREQDATLFLSSEEISRAGGPGGVVDLAMVREIFAGFEITVLCVLRVQWQFLQSVYLELARNRMPPPPPILLQQALETGIVDGLWCDFTGLYDRLCAVFSPADIRLLDFEALRTGPGGLVGGLLRQAGLALDANELSPVNNSYSNASPRALPVWARLAIAGGQSATGDLLAPVETAFDLEYGTGRPSSLFTRAEIARITDHFAPRNTTLAARAGTPVLQTPMPDADTVHREDMGAAFWLRAARRIWMAGSCDARCLA
ncbi:hypothetical protein U5922_017000 [Aquicoccus sp. G2-2]|uniref:hypothetical protein n=1 Tax=Aquicoccus sp. G2-2 TaxID=3092120 RepID=UPI002AE06486|nr:hypothetical protein [Aquicoccus sp. G2-2]MEA1115082.1 hypothetical protein [Aquicoccus sp. G2-2]